ncbi:MAG: CHAT domain-containing protein [Burkholderiales bacterium]
MANDPRRIRINGQRDPLPALPYLFAEVQRGAGAAADTRFLPPDLLTVEETFDLSAGKRDAVGGAVESLTVEPGKVVVLELSDGVTVITSPARLHDVLDGFRLEGQATPDLTFLERRVQGTGERGFGDLVQGALRRVTTLTVGTDRIVETAARELQALVGGSLKDVVASKIEFGATWLGTRLLMKAIESQLDQPPGLYRWAGVGQQAEELIPVDDAALAADARGPYLLFIHGTGSNTNGGFGDLKRSAPADWRALAGRYGDRILAFEHRTFSESPIENALALAKALPQGATVDVVTHSRGGLVGDFLGLGVIDPALIDAHFGEASPGHGDDSKEAYAAHRTALRELGDVLQRKGLRVERYVRVAAPARGTRLASENLDVFLSGLLTLIGLIPVLRANPIYGAVKRIVLEIARNRMRPDVVPGIEAMLPESPVGAFLARARPADGMSLAIIAGDIEGGGLLKRLGVLFTDTAFFDGVDNDLVVDTDSMSGGLARPGQARFRFEQGPDVSHFNYFENSPSREALCQWLTARDADDLPHITAFAALESGPAERTLAQERDHARALVAARGAEPSPQQPVVIVLPGVMGSHLRLRGTDDRVWFDPLDIASGGLEKLCWEGLDDDVEAEKLFDRFYGDLCDHLSATHRVERFPYDWRKPVEAAARRLAKRIEDLLDETRTDQPPIRLLAHSMGGLVVRAMIAARPDLWDRIHARDGGRFVMLGTPNQGSHSMVSTLLGKDDTMRKLARLVDMKHDLQDLLDIIKEFRGALQLLPQPGFVDEAGAQAQDADYYRAELWPTYRARNRDFWFGDGIVGAPTKAALDEARALWSGSADFREARLPDKHQERIVYVCGQSLSTPCGLRLEGGKWKILVTAQGDGTVTWKSGLIRGLERERNVYFMQAEHGALPSTERAFPAIVDLLQSGDTQRRDQLSRSPSMAREALDVIRSVDVGPVPYPTVDEVLDGLAGHRRARLPATRKAAVLKVSCTAMDLRFATRPVMVGHYDRDAISGAEAIIDRELVRGELSMRHHLGLYAGRLGTATVVLMSQSEQQRKRGSLGGALVIGLGELGELSIESLTEAVRAGVLRYLMQLLDNESVCGVRVDDDMRLATLILGYNSTTNISIEASVGAIVRGTLEANNQFTKRMKRSLRVTDLEFVELYLDAAISATKALQRVAGRLNDDAARHGMRVEAAPTLRQKRGWRHRLDAQGASTYWPRIIVTDADRQEDLCPPGSAGGDGNAAAGAGAAPDDAQRRREAARLKVAERLKFVYLGQRARAESFHQQRQPGLVERLMERAISDTSSQGDFSRTLFQILVPHDFKETARQIDRLVLVVDGYTANLPWELMAADDTPLATRMAMVRQFTTGTFRVRVRPTLERRALVIGNPPTDGFDAVFPDTKLPALPFLRGAVEEADRVVGTLRENGITDGIESAIGREPWNLPSESEPSGTLPSPGPRAIEIINKLYRHNYRIVHIAAHGIHAMRGADGLERTGVVLSDGVLITAAEIEAMEVVPDLVFLNCCHLGTIDAQPNRFNRLAYSLARRLIEIGVRAVIVAGWAVDDEAARQFAETFYRSWLHDRRTLGDAVFEARTGIHRDFGERCNTWGAFQVYGDPGHVFDPQGEAAGRAFRTAPADWTPVAPEELVDRLAGLQLDITRSEVESRSAAEARSAQQEGVRLLARSPQDWHDRPDVQFTWARLLADLGADHFDEARGAYIAALGSADMDHFVPTRAIEDLANLEARVGERTGDLERAEGALERLDHLSRAVTLGRRKLTQEHAALVASATKRLAAIYAGMALRPGAVDASGAAARCMALVSRSAEAYRAASGEPGTDRFKPYLALNGLAMEFAYGLLQFALDGAGSWAGDPVANQAGMQLADKCTAVANANFTTDPNLWNAVMPADARLLTALLARRLADPKASDQELAAIFRAYDDVLSGVRWTDKEIDSVARHLRVMSLLMAVAARGLGERRSVEPPDAQARAERLRVQLDAIADHLQPEEDPSRGRPTSPEKAQPSDGAAFRPAAKAMPAVTKKTAPKKSAAKDRKVEGRVKPKRR